MNKLATTLALLWVVGCGSDNALPSVQATTTVQDAGGASADGSVSEVELHADTVPPTELQADDVSAAMPGSFGWPCTANTDCDSAVCLQTENGKQCSKTCTENCPQGYACEQNSTGGGDNVFYCFSRFTRLCNPCMQNTDCNDGVSVENVCLDRGPDGKFCGVSCASAADCPQGYACNKLPDSSTPQCIPAGGAMCTCNPRAQELKPSTTCFNAASPSSCKGTRACGTDGLSPCNIQTKPETCNGLDDNCNGQTDEGLCDDGNQCTVDTCNTDGSCKHAQLQGTPCDDGNQCTGTDKCAAGKCVGGALKLCDDSNPCTDDTCDPAGGCLFTSNKDPCDDGNQCTLNDKCSEKKCVGGPPPNCDDKNFCTIDSCDPGLGCYHTPYTTGAPLCDDKNKCTVDTCANGQCGHTVIPGCK